MRWAVLALLALTPSFAFADCGSLSRGSSGPAVAAVQQVLYAAYQGFPSPTGYFGPVTEAALKQWQHEHGIEALGIAGPQTAAAMKIDLCPGSSVGQIATTKQSLIAALLAQVKILQTQLAALLAASSGHTPIISTTQSTTAPSNTATTGSTSSLASTAPTTIVTTPTSTTTTTVDVAATADQRRMSDLAAVKTALESYFMDHGAYPGVAGTYYWVSDNNYAEPLPCSSMHGGLKPYLSGVCTLMDPASAPYAYEKLADGSYVLGARFESASNQGAAFTYGGKTLIGYFRAPLVVASPSNLCLSPSSDARSKAQAWLDAGNSVCFTAGDFNITPSPDDGSAGLTVDGTKISRNGLVIRGAGAGATRLHYSGCNKAIELKGTLRDLDVRDFSILGSMTSYYTDGTTPAQCSQQIALGDEVGSSNIVNADIHRLDIENVRLGISLMGGCTAYTQPSSGSCYCTGTNCHVNNVIEDNTIKNIYGMRYLYGPGQWTDQSTGTAIGSQVEQGLIVRRNTISNVSRHSIYISFGFPDGSYYIWNNTISDHRATGVGLVDFANLTSAIVIARSQSYAEVLRNSITNSKAFGISVETGPIDGGKALVSGNTFSLGAMPDIWITSTGPVILSGNTDGGAAASCIAGANHDTLCSSFSNVTMQ